MGFSKDDFRAWYGAGADGGSEIMVAGKVTESDGGATALVRAEPQGINPLMLMLKLVIKPYDGGPNVPHIAFEHEIRYAEPSKQGAFSDVHIESAGGGFTLKVGAAT